LLLDLLLGKHFLGEREQLLKSSGLRADLPLPSSGRYTWRCG